MDSERKSKAIIFLHGPVKTSTKIPEDEIKHLKVLRVREGERIKAINGNGIISYGVIRDDWIFEALEIKTVPLPVVKAYIPMLKSTPHNFMLKNLPSFPIRDIILIRTHNTVVKREWGQRDEKLLKEGMKQSGNPWMPTLKGPFDLYDIPSREDLVYGDMTSANMGQESPYNSFLAGPEGGFTKDELTFLRSHFSPINLSPHILRGESAVIALAAYLSGLKINIQKGKIKQ